MGTKIRSERRERNNNNITISVSHALSENEKYKLALNQEQLILGKILQSNVKDC